MNRYTFFLEYLGGTYVSQINATGILEAPKIWIEALDQEDIFEAKVNFKDELLQSFDIPPTPIEGIKNTWSLSGLVDHNLATIHFTQTVK